MTWYAALSPGDCRPVLTRRVPSSVSAPPGHYTKRWVARSELCAVAEAAHYIGVSDAVVYRRIKRGDLRCEFNAEGHRRVYRREVERLRRSLRKDIDAAPPATVFIKECWPFVAGPPGPDMPFATVLSKCLPPSPFESSEWREGDVLHLVWAVARRRKGPQQKYGTVRFTRVEREGERRLVHYVAEEALA